MDRIIRVLKLGWDPILYHALQDFRQNEWLVHLTVKLPVNDPGVSGLLTHNPFLAGASPCWVCAELFRNNFTALGSLEARAEQRWRGERLREYLRPVNLVPLNLLVICNEMSYTVVIL